MGKTTFAIMGAGALGHAMAADLALRGYPVRIQNRTASVMDKINEQGGILATGEIEGLAKLELATPDVGAAVDGADVIMFTMPGNGYRNVARQLAPHVNGESVIFLHPGQTLGSLEVLDELRKNGVTELPTFIEAHTSILTCRLNAPGKVLITGIKDKVWLGTFPTNRSARCELLVEPYPSLRYGESILRPGLCNLNPIVHPFVTLGNIGRVDLAEDWLFYYQGYTESISALIEKKDLERQAIATRLDTPTITLREFFKDAYDLDNASLVDTFRANPAYAAITGPKSTQTRLLLEDIPTGLIPYASMGRQFGVATPLIDSVINVVSALYETDFAAEGRTMENLGISDLTRDQFLELIETGGTR